MLREELNIHGPWTMVQHYVILCVIDNQSICTQFEINRNNMFSNIYFSFDYAFAKATIVLR